MEETISYTLKEAHAQNLAFGLRCIAPGAVIVTSPFGIDQLRIENFVFKKYTWILEKIRFFQKRNSKPVRIFSQNDYHEHKEQARTLVHERLAFYQRAYPYTWNNVSIKNQKTCWGSCSSKRNININYKIIFLSPRQQDYLIVHELCHLQEFNHSQKFWILVAKTIPDYRELRKELRHHNLLFSA